MARVLVTRPLTEGGTDPLVEAGHEIVLRQDANALPADELVRLAAECDGIVCHLTDRIASAVLESGRSGSLQVVANAAVGYDNIDVVSANAMGITVCNTPGVLDDTTADLAFLLILTATRLASVEITSACAALRDSSSSTPRKPRPSQIRARTSGAFSPIPPANTSVSTPPSAAAKAPIHFFA